MINTFVATASAGLFWMLAERLNGHKGSALGFCSGIVAGLVAVTPAAGNSGPFGAIVLGAVASVVCYYAVSFLKPKLGYDDSLDAFGIHGIGGMIGAIGTGIVYAPSLGGPGQARFLDGRPALARRFIDGRHARSSGPRSAPTIAIYAAKLVTGLRVSRRCRARRPRPRRAWRARVQLIRRGSSCGHTWPVAKVTGHFFSFDAWHDEANPAKRGLGRFTT